MRRTVPIVITFVCGVFAIFAFFFKSGTAPNTIFINVDLPAPFSPSTAWISPACTVRLMSSLALTAGYCLLMPLSSSLGAFIVLSSA